MEFGKLNYASGIQPFLYCVLIIATHCNQQLLSTTFIVQWQWTYWDLVSIRNDLKACDPAIGCNSHGEMYCITHFTEENKHAKFIQLWEHYVDYEQACRK